MGELWARVLAIGLVAAVVPVPVVIVLVILAGPGGLVRAWWFVAGFAGSLLLAGTTALLLAGASRAAVDPRVLSAIGLAIGVAFLAMAARLALRRHRDPDVSGATALTVSGLAPGRLAALGVVAGALNPKTLPIFLTGVAAIAMGSHAAVTRALALVLLTATASVGVVVPPLLLAVAPGQGTARVLARLQHAVAPHVAAVAIGLLALVGLAYVGLGVAGLR